MVSRSVDLTGNCYRIYSRDYDLTETLFQYEIEVSLIDSNLSGDVDKPTLPLFIKRMKDQQEVPKELRRKIVSAAVDQWLAGQNSELEDQFVKCDLVCYKLAANSDLLGSNEDTKLLNVLYCNGNLQQSTLKFLVQLKKTKLDCLSLLNIVIGVDGRTSPTLVDQSSTVTTTYNAGDPIMPHNSSVLLRGQTVQLEQLDFGPALSICNTSGWFYEPLDEIKNLVNYLREALPTSELDRGLEPSVVSYLNKELAGRQVEVTHIRLFDLPLRVRVHEIVLTPPDRLCSIREHFANNFGIKLKYPNLPRVVFYLERDRHETPMELCQLFAAEEGPARELAPDQQAMLELKPMDYFERVERHIKCLADSNEANLRKIGVSIDTQPIRVTGRVLHSVRLFGGPTRYDSASSMIPSNGRFDARDKPFLIPVKLGKFSITLIGGTRALMEEYDNLQEFVVEYCRVGQSKGVGIDKSKAQVDMIVQENEKALKETLRKHVEKLNKQSFGHSIVVLADDCQHICSYVHFLETQFKYSGRRSTRLSCLQLAHLKQILTDSKRMNDTPLLDLWTKYNSQLGGFNYQFDTTESPQLEFPDDLLILGVDVCNADRDDEFSVVAVVGMWSIASKRRFHSTQLRAQPTCCGDRSRDEQVVDDVGRMIVRILDSFKIPNQEKSLPSKILILFNGILREKLMVAESSGLDKIVQVLGERYAKIGAKTPRVSCFQIQQRHGARFKPRSPNEVDHQVPPGTIIVDSNRFGHDAFAFRAAPNYDSEGTVEPPIARKLEHGVSSMNDRYYQQLIMALCCLSICSTKCTSVPAPVDLAEKASRRGRDIALAWKEECFSDGNFIEQLNEYFTNFSGIPVYLETLFYV